MDSLPGARCGGVLLGDLGGAHRPHGSSSKEKDANRPTAPGEGTREDLDRRQLHTRLGSWVDLWQGQLQGGEENAAPPLLLPDALPFLPFPFLIFLPPSFYPHIYPLPFSFLCLPALTLGLHFLSLSLSPSPPFPIPPPPLSISLPSSSQHGGLGRCPQSCFKFIAQ